MKVSLTKFGDWLLGQLVERNWSQAEMARRSHLTRQAISQYINGRNPQPSLDAAALIAHALDIPPTEVFRAAGILPELPTMAAARQEVFDYKLAELSPEDQDLVLEFIEFIQHRKKSAPAQQVASREGEAPPEMLKRPART